MLIVYLKIIFILDGFLEKNSRILQPNTNAKSSYEKSRFRYIPDILVI